jgi:type IV pilus assembly protein PilB
MIATQVKKELEHGADVSIISFVDALIEDAYHLRASDIHLEPEDKEVKIRFRIDGVLQDVLTFPREMYIEVLSRIKILAHLRTDEHQTAQDGRFRYLLKKDNKPIDVRVSVVPTFHEENVVMRLLADQDETRMKSSLWKAWVSAKRIRKSLCTPFASLTA